ncbi:MAG TPA: PAS domain S-box protein [Candidatus Methylacidiphilales bacterium]
MTNTLPSDRSRQLLAAIVDSSDDAIISKNLQGIITSWNRSAERIFGYTAEEAVGRSILILIPPERQQEEPRILQSIRQGEKVDHFETIRRTKEGRLINVSVTISPVRDDSGTIVGASKIVRDVTQELDISKRLRGSEERFRITLSSIGDAVIATDHQGNVNFMNAVAENLTGWTEADARGIPLPTIFHIVNEFTREPVENPVLKVLKTGGIVGLANHTILIAKDGSERPIDDSGAPIREASGEISGVVLVFRDVTERRAAEVAAQRLAAIVHSSDDAIIGKDLSGIITSWNQGAERIFGYSEQEIVGQSIMTLIPPELRDQERAILARLSQGERVEHFETTRVSKSGQSLQVSLTVSPIKVDEGHVIGASKIARDITERKRLDQALAEAQKQLQFHADDLEKRVAERTAVLQKTIAELEAFSYSLSHDMRAPLRAIQSYQQIILEDHSEKLDASITTMLQKAIGAAQRMDRMILDLLTYTRLSHEPMPLEPIDVEKLIQGIIQERLDLQEPRAEITVASPLPKVIGNEASLTQCIGNLLDNAVKFVAPGTKPKVRIYTEYSDGLVRLWVEDNGLGMDVDAQKQAFRMFQRFHGKKYPGTGIGLAIVRKAVERMNGRAGIESHINLGSRFWLQLPEAAT